MERHLGEERLIAPNDFTSTAVSRNIQKDLVPPSHFAGPHRVVQVQGTTTAIPWANSLPSGDVGAPGPWSGISQAQEILELRKDNRRITLLHKDTLTGKIPLDPPPGFQKRYEGGSKQWSSLEMEWRLEAEKHKAETESLKKQVAALKDALETHRDETRDSILKRQNHELEAVHEELFQAKMELSQTREELIHNNAQKEKLSSELQRLRGQFTEENAKLRRDAERSKEEARECALKAEAEEGAKQQALRLSEQLTEIHKKQEVELHASHRAELATARKTNSELQDRLESVTSEMLQLKSSLVEITTERDELREHLSQMGQAFEKQSATLHSLRNYIGQLSPENSEKERLNDTVERLNKEKAALQVTAELLTVRLNAANEILALQEEQMRKKSSTDPLVKNNSEGLQVLHLWREKVFKLCVQLRCKDVELREEKDNLLSEVRSMEQQLQQEQHQASVLQHSLDDRIAELDLERVAKETLKQDLSLSHKQNSELKSQNQRVEAELKVLTEGVHRFSQAFESKVADVDAALIKLYTLTQRLTFAKGRVETIQGLIIRKVTLQKFQQASKQTDVTNLQTELSLVREERHKLTQELKRTPELISKTLADLKEQHEIKLKQQQQELEQSWLEVQRAVASREEAEQRRQQVQAQLEESRINLEELSSELLNQQERSKRVLQERVSEIETCCAEKLREMELQVNTAKREHTKAVMILRQFEREAARKRDELAERGIQDKQLKNVDKDKHLLLTTADVGGLMSDYTRTRTVAPQEKSPERTHPLGAKVQLPAHERLLSVLEELQSLSAAVVSSTEDSAEEEETDILTAREDPQAVHT